jgi:hypothetical protein
MTGDWATALKGQQNRLNKQNESYFLQGRDQQMASDSILMYMNQKVI